MGPYKLFMQDFSIGKNYLVGVDLKAHSVKLPQYGNQFKFHFLFVHFIHTVILPISWLFNIVNLRGQCSIV